MPPLSLPPETRQTIGFIVGLVGLSASLVVSLSLGRTPDPTLLLLFGGLAGLSLAAPKSGGG